MFTCRDILNFWYENRLGDCFSFKFEVLNEMLKLNFEYDCMSTIIILLTVLLMNIVKNRLRSKMEDEFLDDCMVLHIEKEYADSESLSNRRVKFS